MGGELRDGPPVVAMRQQRAGMWPCVGAFHLPPPLPFSSSPRAGPRWWIICSSTCTQMLHAFGTSLAGWQSDRRRLSIRCWIGPMGNWAGSWWPRIACVVQGRTLKLRWRCEAIWKVSRRWGEATRCVWGRVQGDTRAARSTAPLLRFRVWADAVPVSSPAAATGLDPWHLAAFEQLTAACKSVVLAAALLHGRIGVQEAVQVSCSAGSPLPGTAHAGAPGGGQGGGAVCGCRGPGEGAARQSSSPHARPQDVAGRASSPASQPATLLHRPSGQAARLEEDYQLEDWGEVEAGHDLDLADAQTRIAAAAVLVRLLRLTHAPPPGGAAA